MSIHRWYCTRILIHFSSAPWKSSAKFKMCTPLHCKSCTSGESMNRSEKRSGFVRLSDIYEATITPHEHLWWINNFIEKNLKIFFHIINNTENTPSKNAMQRVLEIAFLGIEHRWSLNRHKTKERRNKKPKSQKRWRRLIESTFIWSHNLLFTLLIGNNAKLKNICGALSTSSVIVFDDEKCHDLFE